LVVALIVTAHTLKPISGLSIVEQIFSATESLSFVLPDFAEVRIAQASYLATAFGQSVRRDEGSRDRAWTQTAFVVPANFAVELPPEPKPRTSARPSTHRVVPRLAAARLKSGIKMLIPELPPAMPLERALALSMPQPEFQLVSMALNRINRRYLQVKLSAERVIVKPLLSQLAGKKSDCNPPAVKTVIAAADADEEQSGRQETEAESQEDFMLDEAVPMESMIFEIDPGPAAPPSRPPCETPAAPEMIVPIQIDYLPKP
jgi:hypothetical protein